MAQSCRARRMKGLLPRLRGLGLEAVEMPDVAIAVGVVAASKPGPAGLFANDERIDWFRRVLRAVFVGAFAQAAGFNGRLFVVTQDGGINVLIRAPGLGHVEVEPGRLVPEL